MHQDDSASEDLKAHQQAEDCSTVWACLVIGCSDGRLHWREDALPGSALIVEVHAMVHRERLVHRNTSRVMRQGTSQQQQARVPCVYPVAKPILSILPLLAAGHA